jgi:hypothetical protein
VVLSEATHGWDVSVSLFNSASLNGELKGGFDRCSGTAHWTMFCAQSLHYGIQAYLNLMVYASES